METQKVFIWIVNLPSVIYWLKTPTNCNLLSLSVIFVINQVFTCVDIFSGLYVYWSPCANARLFLICMSFYFLISGFIHLVKATALFFQFVLTILNLLYPHINFRVSLSNFIKSSVQIFIEIALHHLTGLWQLEYTSCSNPKHDTPLYLLSLSLMSLRIVSRVLM